MADTVTPLTLQSALGGLRITGAENPYGMGLLALTQAAPSLYNPYGKPGANFGIALGQALLSGLLGYQAKKQATEESLQATNLASQLLNTPSTQRASLLEGLQQQGTPVNVMSKLTEISPLLLQSELAAKAEQATKEQEFNRSLMLEGLKQGLIPTGKENLFGVKPEEGQQFLTPKKVEDFDKLRTQFNTLPEVKDYSAVKTAATVVGQAVKDPSAVATQELVRRAVQLIEPGMAVREGEQAAIAASQSIPDQWKGALQKAMTGEGGLGKDVREGIIRIAERSYNAHANAYDTTRSYYQGLAAERGLGNKDISYLGKAPTFEEVVNSLSKKKSATTNVPELDQAPLERIAQRLSQLSTKGLANLTPAEKEELDSLAAEYKGIKYGR